MNAENELMILNTIVQAVHTSFDLQQIYKIALDKVIELENVDMSCIYLVDAAKNEALMQDHRNFPEEFIQRARRIPYPKGATWKVINTGKILNVKNAAQDPDVGPAGRNLGFRSMLGIPVNLEGKTIGVIWLLSYREHFFTESEENLLTSICTQIATAIAKAKLYRELSKKNHYETIISAVTKSVHQSINLQDVLENAVEAMSNHIDKTDYIGIHLVEGREAVLKSHRSLPDWYIERAGRIPYPKGYTWKVITEGKPRYCPDVGEDTVIGPAGRELGIKSYLSMPIRFKDKIIGTININSFQKNAFDEEELRILEIVAQQIEIALSNAQQAEALRQSEERYRTLFNQSPVGVYIFDNEFKITQCNERMVQILQSSHDKIVGLDIRKLKNQIFIPAMERVFKGESCHQEGFYEATTSSVKLWLSVTLTPLWNANGNVIGGIGVAEDITQRKQAEEVLLESEERYRSLVETVPDVIFSLSTDGKISTLNPAFEKIMGWQRNEWIDKPFLPIVHPDDIPLAMEKYKQGLEDKTPMPFELRILSRSGKYLSTEFFGTPRINNGEVIGILGIARDIT
jgi:PAS domain S-box-containing protein